MRISITTTLSLILLLVSALALFYNISTHPNVLYNWEHYTSWRLLQEKNHEPFNEAADGISLRLTDGLMTDSGLSPLVFYPIHLSTVIFGMNLFALRLWPVLVGILTIQALFFFGKKFFNKYVGFMSAFILLFSQPFLLYARTATNVGMSIISSIFTIWLIINVYQNPKKKITYLLLIMLLIINSYLYAPMRFLLPISIVFMILSITKNITYSFWKNTTRVLLLTNLLSFSWIIRESMLHYYNGRGEQIVSQFNNTIPEFKALFIYIFDNIIDLISLLYSIDKSPTILGFANSTGQMIHPLYIPLLCLGVILTTIIYFRKLHMMLLLWFLIFTIPILFTNNVHIGRLIFSIVPISIFISLGIYYLAIWILHFNTIKSNIYVRIVIVVITILFIGFVSLKEAEVYYFEKTYDTYPASLIKSLADTNKIIILNVDHETLAFWTIYFYLGDNYHIYDISELDKIDSLVNPQENVIIAKKNKATIENLTYFCKRNYSQIVVVGHTTDAFNEVITSAPCEGKIIR